MALPTLRSTGRAGKQILGQTLAPAMAPITQAKSAMLHPLAAMGAAPIVAGGASAVATMFTGGTGKGGGSKGGSKKQAQAQFDKLHGGKHTGKGEEKKQAKETNLLEAIQTNTSSLGDMKKTLDAMLAIARNRNKKDTKEKKEEKKGRKKGTWFSRIGGGILGMEGSARNRLEQIEEKREIHREKRAERRSKLRERLGIGAPRVKFPPGLKRTIIGMGGLGFIGSILTNIITGILTLASIVIPIITTIFSVIAGLAGALGSGLIRAGGSAAGSLLKGSTALSAGGLGAFITGGPWIKAAGIVAMFAGSLLGIAAGAEEAKDQFDNVWEKILGPFNDFIAEFQKTGSLFPAFQAMMPGGGVSKAGGRFGGPQDWFRLEQAGTGWKTPWGTTLPRKPTSTELLNGTGVLSGMTDNEISVLRQESMRTGASRHMVELARTNELRSTPQELDRLVAENEWAGNHNLNPDWVQFRGGREAVEKLIDKGQEAMANKLELIKDTKENMRVRIFLARLSKGKVSGSRAITMLRKYAPEVFTSPEGIEWEKHAGMEKLMKNFGEGESFQIHSKLGTSFRIKSKADQTALSGQDLNELFDIQKANPDIQFKITHGIKGRVGYDPTFADKGKFLIEVLSTKGIEKPSLIEGLKDIIRTPNTPSGEFGAMVAGSELAKNTAAWARGFADLSQNSVVNTFTENNPKALIGSNSPPSRGSGSLEGVGKLPA